MRFDTLRAEQEGQTAAEKAATEKDNARKEAKRIKRGAHKERKVVELAELAAKLAEPRAARPSWRSPSLMRWQKPPPRSSRCSRKRHSFLQGP